MLMSVCIKSKPAIDVPNRLSPSNNRYLLYDLQAKHTEIQRNLDLTHLYITKGITENIFQPSNSVMYRKCIGNV